jgi:SAM-dependent methyltransferase
MTSDVGHGTGESLILLLTHEDIPRPRKVTGITSLAMHSHRSKTRVEKLETCVDTEFFAGDAVWHSDIQNHPLNPGRQTSCFDGVLALDCAYHFHTRLAFIQQTLQALRPGGRIALADICFSVSGCGWLAYLAPLAKGNIVSKTDYLEQMLQTGFDQVDLEDITEQVFPGFLNFLSGRGIIWSLFALMFRTYIAYSGLRFVIVSGRRPLQ